MVLRGAIGTGMTEGVIVENVKVTCNAAADFQEDCVVDNIACNWDKMIGLHIMVLSLFQRVFKHFVFLYGVVCLCPSI